MDDEKKLGVYWGNSGLFFVETQETSPVNIFQIPFDEDVKEALKNGPASINKMDLGSNIEGVLREQGLIGSPVNLSLPAKDIIFRSFVIPWMEEHEVKSAVEFEASKYIPFSLEKLSFSFYPIRFAEKNTKWLRIIFVAIKSNTLSSYTKTLEDASLQIDLIEPAPSSLIRALSSKLKNVIPKNQTIALIEKENVARITIVDNDIPQFVREFHLSTMGTANQAEENSEDSIKKLIGEVRISLDYFDRQNEQLQVEQAILLSSSDLEELSQVLEKNLPISIIPIDDQSILGDPSKKELGYLNAYGASIISTVSSVLYFKFSKPGSGALSKPKVSIPRKPINYKLIIKAALVCVPLIIGSIVASGIAKQNFKKDISALSQKLGRFKDADVSMIEQKEKNLKDRLTYFNNIRMDSSAASILLLIPNLLPEGTWIRNLDIMYDDSATFKLPGAPIASVIRRRPVNTRSVKDVPPLLINIEGYAYSENRNQQFRLVNRLLRNLKDNKEFSGFFSDIDVETTKSQKLNDFSVTAFKIECKRKDEPKRPQ
ncbi:MAG: pilus assembly protein PilM [Candidatus Omnitrophica bacterium]|nr:pilus assembly protein PilM [Candidatus Omnitrophota bacterium]